MKCPNAEVEKRDSIESPMPLSGGCYADLAPVLVFWFSPSGGILFVILGAPHVSNI